MGGLVIDQDKKLIIIVEQGILVDLEKCMNSFKDL
uniref:Uncharacterized protein n=1 Tax=Rhizophora mucronata TaxID=61149 RepID=A0A2P2IP94_RHIMU